MKSHSLLLNRYYEEDVFFCFLLSTGRNGSVLLQSLLDGSENISMIPQLYLMEDQIHWQEVTSKNYEEALDQFIDFNRDFFLVAGHPWLKLDRLDGENSPPLFFSKSEFKAHALKYLSSIHQINGQELYIAIHLAYDALLGRSHNKNVLFHHIHLVAKMDEYWDFLTSFGVPIKFISMARAPGPSVTSYFTNWSTYYRYTNIEYFYSQIMRYVIDIEQIRARAAPDHQIFAIKLDELHKAPAAVLGHLLTALKTDYDPSIHLESTLYSKAWYGDAISAGPVSGFNPAIDTNKSWEAFFWRKDIKFLNFCMHQYQHDYRYPKSPNTYGLLWFFLSLITPLKIEVGFISGELPKAKEYLPKSTLRRIAMVSIFGLRFRLTVIKALVKRPSNLSAIEVIGTEPASYLDG